MQTVDLASWEEFEEWLHQRQDARGQPSDGHKSPFLFRGHGNVDWHLETTLERNARTKMSFETYFTLILRVKPQVETFTDVNWTIPSFQEYQAWLRKYDTLMPWRFPAYDYMVYLRHHGFPSPLLDWTRSPYVAAYFAFKAPAAADGRVSLYLFWERPEGFKGSASNEPSIHSMGPYVRSHRRHFLQQSEYTICIVREDEWCYARHEDVFARGASDQDILWKVNIPATERLKVLQQLDGYNLNALSLFGSEESLMETMAMRELYFKAL
jgi:hypothetical protein